MHFQHWSLLGLLTFAIQHVAAVPLPPPGIQCCTDCVCESNVVINSSPRVTARAPRNKFCLHAPGISNDCSEDVSSSIHKRNQPAVSADYIPPPTTPMDQADTSRGQRITNTPRCRSKSVMKGCTNPPTKRTLPPITLPASLTNPNAPSYAPIKHQPRTDPELLANQTLTAMEAYIERAIDAGTFKNMTQTTHKDGSVTFRVQIATQEMVFEMPALWPPVQGGVLRRRANGGWGEPFWSDVMLGKDCDAEIVTSGGIKCVLLSPRVGGVARVGAADDVAAAAGPGLDKEG